MSSESTDIARAINIGLSAEDHRPDVKLTEEQITWLADWLAGEGFGKVDGVQQLKHGMIVKIENRVMRVDLIQITNRFQNFVSGEYEVSAELELTGRVTQEDVNRAFGGKRTDTRA